MELASPQGNLVSLSICGYEFPGTTGSGERDWDANWLIIEGAVKSGDQEWTFRHPCLTTWEARELSDWLRAIADGSRQPAPVDPENGSGGLLSFTEPNIAFAYQRNTSEAATLRVYLSLEALPSSMTGTDNFEYFVELVLTREDLAIAADTWDDELRAFPVRA